MKHFEVKKWVRLKKRREDVTYQALLQHAKEHKMTVKDFNWHKSNGRIATATVIDEINSFKYRKGNANRANFKSEKGKTCSKCSTSHPLRECPVRDKKCQKCGNKNHFSTCCRSKQKGPQDSKRPPHGRSTMRCPKGRGRWSKSRSKSRSNTRSAHSIEMNSFQDHPQLYGRLSSNVHERLPNDIHGRHSFQDPEESTDFLSRTFHTIYRSKSMLSISNEMDPDGKTKILTILNIKLPHWKSIDKLWVKVDGAEANILPLDSFRTMFPHALDENRYPKTGFLDRSMINLECYNDGRLINHGCIKLKLQHYLEKSFQ